MRQFWTAVCLLWLAGLGLRLTVLAVPPILSMMQADLRLSGTAVGMLSGLPLVLFAIAALPGSLLIARLGAKVTLISGLLVAGIASAFRGVVLDVSALYAATIVMGAGIAIMQPALPPLVRMWLPRRITFGAAVYSNGLLMGETLPVMLMIPVVLPLVDGSWRAGLAVWSIPLVAIALLVMIGAPRGADAGPIGAAVPSGGRSWWPDWRNPLIWQIGFVFGSVNSVYFGSNAFLPGHLTEAGRTDLIAPALTALNFGQLPASFVLLAIAGALERRAWPFVVCGVVMLACVAGMAVTASAWTVVLAGVLGFIGAVVMVLGFALPPLLTVPADVPRLSAAMFTISYSEALVVSVSSGAVWDAGGRAWLAFLPIGMSALPLLFVPPAIRLGRRSAEP